MNKLDKLNSALTDGTMDVVMIYEDRCDVWHCTDEYVAEAVEQTSTADALAQLITLSPEITDQWGNPILDNMRDSGYLEDYQRGGGTFCEHVASSIRQNFYEGDWLEYNTEKYDHKRGCTTISATVKLPMRDVIKLDEAALSGWTLQVTTDLGNLIIE
mgnify:CR=1 FL=1|tara:strand:+ start:139 stop:612 length:474 start_codon:yes stop_codon:yes gene_type:complete